MPEPSHVIATAQRGTNVSADRSGKSVALTTLVAALDAELRTHEVPDSSMAFNGLQVANSGQVRRIAVAVDASLASIEAARNAGADLLIVHHGLFWAGVQPIVGKQYDRLRTLMSSDLALYSSHIPLDMHQLLGNNVRLAHAFNLTPTAPFAHYKGVHIGVRGSSNVDTAALLRTVAGYAAEYGGTVRTSIPVEGRVTKHWAICSGMGVSSDALLEARNAGVDTLIVGEGTHHSAVDSAEYGVCVMYAGHYATETLGVQALATWIEERFEIPWSFLMLPTGL